MLTKSPPVQFWRVGFGSIGRLSFFYGIVGNPPQVAMESNWNSSTAATVIANW